MQPSLHEQSAWQALGPWISPDVETMSGRLRGPTSAGTWSVLSDWEMDAMIQPSYISVLTSPFSFLVLVLTLT